VVLSVPGGARLSVRYVKGAAQVARHAPATVDRYTYATPYAFCVGVFAPGYAGPPGGCERLAPPTLDDPVEFTGLGDWIGGAVPAAAATVELVPSGGAPVRTPAVAGDYHGAWAGRVKFFLAQLPGGPARRILVFDAAGALIGGETFRPDRVTGPSVRLGGGSLPAHQRWWARVRTEDIAAPAAAAPDRHVPAACSGAASATAPIRGSARCSAAAIAAARPPARSPSIPTARRTASRSPRCCRRASGAPCSCSATAVSERCRAGGCPPASARTGTAWPPCWAAAWRSGPPAACADSGSPRR
jgi:hypothetical protein